MSAELGRRIARARDEKGLTQEQLAAEIGVTLRTVGNWERGATVPRARWTTLESVLGISLDEDFVASPGGRVESEVTNADVLAAIKVMRQEVDERLGKVERAVFGGNEDAEGP